MLYYNPNHCLIKTLVQNSTCAGVGSIRLIDGPSSNEGRVEVCNGGIWGTICGNYWRYIEAQVVCRQLGFSSIGKSE